MIGKGGIQKWVSSFSFYIHMRYYSKPPVISKQAFGETYICEHPVYSKCTLYKIKSKGLAVIQQRYDPKTKMTWWSEIDDWIANALWLEPKFHVYLQKRVGEPENGLYPTATVRQAMWAARLKPLKKERWETVFDRSDI